jgi:hypothetical protein
MHGKLSVKEHTISRAIVLALSIALLAVTSGRLRADTSTCGGASITLPFTDVPASNIFFCAIAEAFFTGLTNGTSATTYSPTQPVTREQMAAFITRTLDQSLQRGSNRAALDQWWIPAAIPNTATTQVDSLPNFVKSDGADLWVANTVSGTVSRVRASDGLLLGTWTGTVNAQAVLVVRGRIFVVGETNPGRLYSIDPTQAPGAAILVTDELGDGPLGIAYDGSRIWTTNDSSVSVVRFVCVGSCVTTLTAGFSHPRGILYDGSHIWVTDQGDNTLKQLNSDGSIVQPPVPVGSNSAYPIFDGTNIWVPNTAPNSVTVVRVKDSAGNPLAQPYVLATLTGNGLNRPFSAAFDGQRVLVTNFVGNSVSLWKATDLTPLGSFSTGANSNPRGACSDGLNFWITLSGTNQLARF